MSKRNPEGGGLLFLFAIIILIGLFFLFVAP
jgi:hypothetical protein